MGIRLKTRGNIMAEGKEVVKEGIDTILKVVEKVYNGLTGSYEIINQNITILCRTNTHKASFVIRSKPGILYQRKIKFSTGRPRAIEIRSLTSTANMYDSVSLTDDGFVILTDKMQEHDLILLEVEYHIKDPNFLNMLVESKSDRETPKGEKSEFWMHAQLKFPSALQKRYERFEVREFELTVQVPVSNYIEMSVPRIFRAEMDALAEFTQNENPHNDIVLAKRYKVTKKRRGGKQFQEVLSEMQRLFLPNTFQSFVDVSAPFEYGEAIKGSSYYESIPFPTWPKFMEVVTRTNLSLDRFAIDGTLVFKRGDFSEEVHKIMGERK